MCKEDWARISRPKNYVAIVYIYVTSISLIEWYDVKTQKSRLKYEFIFDWRYKLHDKQNT